MVPPSSIGEVCTPDVKRSWHKATARWSAKSKPYQGKRSEVRGEVCKLVRGVVFASKVQVTLVSCSHFGNLNGIFDKIVC